MRDIIIDMLDHASERELRLILLYVSRLVKRG